MFSRFIASAIATCIVELVFASAVANEHGLLIMAVIWAPQEYARSRQEEAGTAPAALLARTAITNRCSRKNSGRVCLMTQTLLIKINNYPIRVLSRRFIYCTSVVMRDLLIAEPRASWPIMAINGTLSSRVSCYHRPLSRLRFDFKFFVCRGFWDFLRPSRF